jgi:hypothetical protein
MDTPKGVSMMAPREVFHGQKKHLALLAEAISLQSLDGVCGAIASAGFFPAS